MSVLNFATNEYRPKEGDHFTVVLWKSHEDNSYVGAPLLAECMDGDLVICRDIRYTKGMLGGRDIHLNLAQVQCRPLSARYVERTLNGPSDPKPSIA